MKILHITNIYPNPFNNGNKVIRDIARTLSEKQKVEQTVIVPVKTTRISKIGKEYTIKNETPRLSEYVVFHFGLPYGFFIGLRLYDSFKRVIEVIANKNIVFDVIHAHTLISDGYIGYKLSKMLGKPLVVSVRGTDVFEQLKFLPQAKVIAQRIANHSKKIIAVSPSLMKELLRYIKVSAEKIEIVPNGIYLKLLPRERSSGISKSNKDKGTINLVFVGHLIPLKNLKRTLEAIRIVVEKGFDVHLNVIGEGLWENSLKKLTNRLGLSENIHFLGMQKHDKTLEVIGISDALILCSTKETFGMVYIEALSQGVPVIYSKGRGIDGFIKNEAGIPCDPFDVKSIANAIERLYDDYWYFKKQAEEFARSYIDQFSMGTICQRLFDLYEIVLKEDRNV